MQLWTKPIEPNGSIAFVIFNSAGAMPSTVSVQLSDLGLHNSPGYNVTEVFDGVHIGIKKPADVLKISVNPTGVFFAKAIVIK